MRYAIYVSKGIPCAEEIGRMINSFLVGDTSTYYISETVGGYEDRPELLNFHKDVIKDTDILIFVAPDSVESDASKGTGIYLILGYANTVKPKHLIHEFYI